MILKILTLCGVTGEAHKGQDLNRVGLDEQVLSAWTRVVKCLVQQATASRFLRLAGATADDVRRHGTLPVPAESYVSNQPKIEIQPNSQSRSQPRPNPQGLQAMIKLLRCSTL